MRLLFLFVSLSIPVTSMPLAGTAALATATVLVVVAHTVAVSVYPVLAHALTLAAAGPSAMVAAGRQSGGSQTDYHHPCHNQCDQFFHNVFLLGSSPLEGLSPGIRISVPIPLTLEKIFYFFLQTQAAGLKPARFLPFGLYSNREPCAILFLAEPCLGKPLAPKTGKNIDNLLFILQVFCFSGTMISNRPPSLYGRGAFRTKGWNEAMEFPKHPFRTHGGAPVPHHKNTWDAPTATMPPPEKVILPMQQHIGAPCIPTVKKGDHVYVGTVVGDNEAYMSVPVHSSVSGTVTDITTVMLTGGQMTQAVVVESDGAMEKDPGIHPPAPITTKEELANAARAAGLVGLGGAGFPAHVKLNIPEGKQIDTLLVNVAECEPYVTSDHREALENGHNVLEGVYKVKEILGVQRVIIAVEDNKPDVIQKLTEIADDPKRDPRDEVRVLALKSRYPQGAEKVLVQACTGRKVPEGKLPADVGCLVMNIGSISFLASYMRTGMPLTLKRVTIDGSAIAHPQNVIVPVGTPIKDVVAFCGGYKSEPKKLIMGGPMMGVAITSDELPILKQNNAILAFDEREATLRQPTACIRCGRCVAACPMNLMPTKLEQATERKDVEGLKALNVMACMECGCCAFSCPAGRRLVQAIRLGKSYVRKAGSGGKK